MNISFFLIILDPFLMDFQLFDQIRIRLNGINCEDLKSSSGFISDFQLKSETNTKFFCVF